MCLKVFYGNTLKLGKRTKSAVGNRVVDSDGEFWCLSMMRGVNVLSGSVLEYVPCRKQSVICMHSFGIEYNLEDCLLPHIWIFLLHVRVGVFPQLYSRIFYESLAGKLAQWLRKLAALAKDWCLMPSTDILGL